MGLVLAAIAVLASLAAVAALVRRSRQRAAALEAELMTALHEQAQGRPELQLTVEPGVITAGGGRSGVTLPRRRLTEAVRKGHGAQALAAAALALLADPPLPLSSSFSLKIHGPRVRARLATGAAMALRPAEPRPAQKWLEDLQLVVTYYVGDHFLTEDHLREQGIDTRDLHGIALAVQRQKFDEDLPRRVLASSPENPRPEILRSKDGSSGAWLLTLADALNPGEVLAARLAGPDWLGLAPHGFSWPTDAGTPQTPPTHPVIDLRIEPEGYRIL